MSEVIPAPMKFGHQRAIKPREVWDQVEPSSEMVWEVCPYIGQRMVTFEKCNHCPAWEQDPDHGRMQRGCYGLAAEACRIAMAALKKFPPKADSSHPGDRT